MQLSTNFSAVEFACHDGNPVPDELMQNLQHLVDGVLQPVRERAGQLTVVSGYRTPTYNKRIGGALKSNHMTAMAADILPGTMSPAALHALVLSMFVAGQLPALGGLGLYPGWVHLDTLKAPDGHLRRWTGNGVGSEQ